MRPRTSFTRIESPYIGVDALLSGLFARLGGEWDGFSAVPQEIVDGGETVVALGRYGGVYKATGVKVDAQFVHVFKFKDGKVASFQQYTDTAQFKDAVSLRAEAPELIVATPALAGFPAPPRALYPRRRSRS